MTLTLGMDAEKIKVIPSTEETYISFSKYVSNYFSIRFLDSYRFLSTSLRQLVHNLPVSELLHTRSHFPDISQFEHARQKNFFPYEFLDSPEKLFFPSSSNRFFLLLSK